MKTVMDKSEISAIVNVLKESGYWEKIEQQDRNFYIARLIDRKDDYLSLPRYSLDDPYRGKYTPDFLKVDRFVLPIRLPDNYPTAKLWTIMACDHVAQKVSLLGIDTSQHGVDNRFMLADSKLLPHFADVFKEEKVAVKIPKARKQRGAKRIPLPVTSKKSMQSA